uniref:Kinesin-like protein KIF24 n=1 Tax=Catagonus wagneri TaxID=51154 RepID=A0A8C3WZ42_9CETA
MTSWLYECLCEADLAQYYPHFTALGLQKIDELANVTMKDYSKLGVHDMNDRKRLFQLIKIVKIMQEEDKAVSSPECLLQTSGLSIKPQKFRSGPRRQLHFDSPADSKDRTTSNNEFELCNLSDFFTNEQKSSYLNILEHMLPDDSQYLTKTRILNAVAADCCVQREVNTSLLSSNHFSPIEGDCDIPIMQRVSHVSGYNYGIPHSYTRQNTSEKENPWTEMEKIRVCVRKRPLGMREVRRGEINIITIEDKETLLVHEKKEAVDLTQYILQHVFYFDEVFGEACTNRDVYMKTTHPLIQHIFNGGNATCFAYGQTGAGKTYTMIGTHQNPGLYALAARDIFRQLEVSQPRRHLFVWISFYEIYCGQLYDLLNRRKRLFAREDSKHVVQIVGLQELQVDSVELLLEVILKGSKERSTGATGVNADSSRSHAIIQIQIKDSAKRTFGRISFIDLAGSERAADARDSDRQTKMEGAEINQSLLALKECIRALDQEHTHTPFRQSKLTQVLKDSFIGNAKTCMIANISPSHVATEHTLNTLRYADRVKELKKGIKCCTSASSRNRTSGNSSPKRIQSSPVALPGDKCSPKKVKLGLPQSLTVAADVTRGKAHPLASHPVNIPFASVPKAPGKRSGSKGSHGWVSQTSSVTRTTRSGHLAKKGAEESAALGSEKDAVSKKTALAGGSSARGQPPSQGREVQAVPPVQKQLVSRADVSLGSVQHPAENSQGDTPARPTSGAWTDIPLQQKAREEHLRFYHQQFQQPPLLRQELRCQPLARFSCQYPPHKGQLQKDTPPRLHSCAESDDRTRAEDLDDSDFSDDSFSHVCCQRTTEQGDALESSDGSFFLHQREQHPEGQMAERRQSLVFSPRTDSDKKGPPGSWVCRREPASRRGLAPAPGRSPSPAPWDGSREEGSAASSGPFPGADLAERPYCSRGDRGQRPQSHGGPAFDLSRDPFRSEVPGQAEDGFSFSLSHMAVPGSPDHGDTVGTPLRAASEAQPAPAAGTVRSSNPFRGGDSGASSGYAAGLMAALTVSLLESPDSGGLDGAGPGPVGGHAASPGDQEPVLPTSSATEHLWLSSSPPDNKPGGDLPALSPSPIRQPGREADPGEASRSGEAALFAQGLAAAGAEAEPGGLQGFLGEPFPSSRPWEARAGQAASSDAADPAGAWRRKRLAGLGGQELGVSTDPIRLLSCSEDIAWLKPRPTPRYSARPDSPTTAGPLHQPALGHTQQMVIQAHQEQLDEMAKLGFKEETLMSQLAPNDFDDFVTQLDEIMALKSKCIQSLRSQLQLYLACHRPAAAPERTAVS